ncbi:MAG TPA: MazG nucleotide pyrophosphohydrolase domain-containing protein [bacterium]|nr:MazG nucleotide pyrophosphohydrolase domain-containing protein [bacterium]HQM51866.1 MazG nucleotide pyrophosphohydrolase domain-containing protein [bacterium]
MKSRGAETVSAATRFGELKALFRTLLGPGGCPWDREQTHETLIPYLREEAEEFIAAVHGGDRDGMREELGDVLLQVMFHAELAAREGAFTVEEVIEGLIGKLTHRHPHVFADTKVSSSREVVANWNRIKAGEKRARRSGNETRPARRS